MVLTDVVTDRDAVHRAVGVDDLDRAHRLAMTLVDVGDESDLVEPRLGSYEKSDDADQAQPLSSSERRGLWYAAGAGIVFAALLAAGTVPADGLLRDPETGDLLRSPFTQGIVAFIFLGAAVLGVAYGIGAGTFKSDADVVKGMKESMESLGLYLVLVFFAAQFVAYFKFTNLGMIFAIKGAELLQASGVDTVKELRNRNAGNLAEKMAAADVALTRS